MKTFVLSTLFLAGAAIAAPTAAQAQPFKLTGLSAKTLTESNTGRIDFTIFDQNDGTSSTCSTAWTIGDETIADSWAPCVDPAFSFTFPDGIESIEAFDIYVQHSQSTNGVALIGEATLNAQAGTSIWVCKEPGQTPGTSEECDAQGDVIAELISHA